MIIPTSKGCRHHSRTEDYVILTLDDSSSGRQARQIAWRPCVTPATRSAAADLAQKVSTTWDCPRGSPDDFSQGLLPLLLLPRTRTNKAALLCDYSLGGVVVEGVCSWAVSTYHELVTILGLWRSPIFLKVLSGSEEVPSSLVCYETE